MKKIIIIGGGISGLAAAHRIQQEISEGAHLECILVEGSDRVGGKIFTSFISFIGIGVVSIPTALLASSLTGLIQIDKDDLD